MPPRVRQDLPFPHFSLCTQGASQTHKSPFLGHVLLLQSTRGYPKGQAPAFQGELTAEEVKGFSKEKRNPQPGAAAAVTLTLTTSAMDHPSS